MRGYWTIFGGDREAIRQYEHQTVLFNERLLQLLQRDLAERKADIEAEQGNPVRQRYHAAQTFLLQRQIADVMKRQATKQTPRQKLIVNADPPCRKRDTRKKGKA